MDLNEGIMRRYSLRKTKEPIRIKIFKDRIAQIENLIGSWSYETKEFMLQRLNQYHPKEIDAKKALKDFYYWLFDKDNVKKFRNLRNPEILTNWKERFQQSGEENPKLAWNKILEKEVSYTDREYMVHRLTEETEDTFVPPQVVEFFEKIYKAYLRKEYTEDPNLPKAPIILVTGPSGSGKSATVTGAIEQVIFDNVLKPEKDYKREVQEVMGNRGIFAKLEDVKPELAEEIEQYKRIKTLKTKLRIPFYRKIMSKKIQQELLELEENGIYVSYSMVTPNDYNTAYANEPGNFLKKAMGNPNITSIRHMEEAHSACGKKDGNRSTGGHEKTLTDTMNILLDEIANGNRDCVLFMTTDQSSKFDNAIYRKIVEKGKIVDMMEYWKHPENIEEVIKIEMKRHNIFVKEKPEPENEDFKTVTPEELTNIVQRIYPTFESRSLNLTPAYIRKLVESIIQIKGDIRETYFDEKVVIREAFKNVAKNIHGELYEKVVGKMYRGIKWNEYIGAIKDDFSRLANNCLLYNISEEKGAVLAGPPGSGKTFLAQAWLGEHPEVTDILLTLNSLQDSNNPWDTTAVVDNLEKLYDIAKMVTPSFVYGDEGDALAPKRTKGETQSDKITNKLLSIIGGEKPLEGVFTTLSTNRLDIMDPALVRSKRLKTMNITGHLRDSDIVKIIEKYMGELPKKEDVTTETIYKSAKLICNTPADYSAFVEEMKNLQKTEFEVIQRLKEEKDNMSDFIKLNYVTLASIVENIDVPQEVKIKSKKDHVGILESIEEICSAVENIDSLNDYPITQHHIQTVRADMARSPTRKGIQQLGDFMHTQLSKEPQVGFVVGVGVMGDTLGILLPIGTSMSYKTHRNKINVTGAVKPSGGIGTEELQMAVEMMRQSSEEALILVENYLQALCPKDNIAKILGDFLEDQTINHQMLTAQYMGGGPSAGFALTINTLSAILDIPVFNDFGITGAPWTKGVTKDEVGSSVIIGGHHKKTEKVLQELDRMYMPDTNYKDMEKEFLINYWEEGKDVRGVNDFRSLVPEVMCINDEHEKKVKELTQKRIDYKKEIYVYYSKDEDVLIQKKEEINDLEREIRQYTESEMVRKVECIKNYLGQAEDKKYTSIEEIFKTDDVKRFSPNQ